MLLFADDQVLLAASENESQCSLHSLSMIISDNNVRISTKTSEVV
jgi:hypothetical protein